MILVLLMSVLPILAYAEQDLEPDVTDVEYAELSYTDAGVAVLSRQKVIGGVAQISSVVPKKTGKIFCGWKVEGKKTIYKPGQSIEIKSDAVLEAQWENGYLPELKLKAESWSDGNVTFSLDFSYGGLMNYAYYEVRIRNLTTAKEDTFEITDGDITVDSLPMGQYKAVLAAKKYDIEYLSKDVNFVVLSGVSAPEAPLKLVMDGRNLVFTDEQPQLIDSYTYIAIRQFCESLDARVEWREEDRSATITLGGTIIKLFENTSECIVNGTVCSLPVNTIIKNGRMLLPLRSVAELCNAQIIWDDNRTVYIYRGTDDAFEENMMFIRPASKRYLGVHNGEIILKGSADFSCGWIFDAVEGGNGIYIIYNLSDIERPLQIKESLFTEGNEVIIDSAGDFDGHLWRVNKNNDGTYTISPANNPGLYLDLDNLTLTRDAAIFEINYISNLEL